MKVHELEVSLRYVQPCIWRRLQVPSDTTLAELHDVLQDAMGWEDDHLHRFHVKGIRYGAGPDWGRNEQDESVVTLAEVAPAPGRSCSTTTTAGTAGSTTSSSPPSASWQLRLAAGDPRQVDPP